MKNIKFIDRKEELSKISKLESHNFFLVLTGRRRIGKTRLLKKAFPEAVYIFVWPDKSKEWFIEQICRENNIPMFKDFGGIVGYFFDKGRIVVIDEFQNFLSVDKSIYGELQKLIDERRLSRKFMKIAAAGSSYSLMNKVFNDTASPLYGRRSEEITLGHLPIVDLFNEMKISLEEFIKLWSVFEGVPYYYELLDSNLAAEKNIKILALLRQASLQNEGSAVFSFEFGGDSKTYSTVLTAIAEGKTKLNEIAGMFENKKNEASKYLDILRRNFNLVRKNTPILDNPAKSKEGRYEINDNFLSFWFYFVNNNRNYIEQERFEELEAFFDRNFSAYVGKKFEKFILLLLKDGLFLDGFRFSKAGRQWGRFEGESGREPYEIDIVAVNESSREILFGECKWQNDANAEDIIKKLDKKATHVKWLNNEREESFAVFARSFSKRIKEFNGKKVYCYGLEDIRKIIKQA